MKTVVSIIVLCLVVYFFPGCHKETEEDKVKKVITNVQKAAEEKDIKKIISSISGTYNDPQGNNLESIRRLLIAYFYQFPKIAAYIPNLAVSVKGSSATTAFQAVLTSKGADESTQGVLPESLGVYTFEVALKKESGTWKVASATWERVGDAGGP